MAKISLSDTGWSLIPEGTYIFKITSVEYKEDFGKLKVDMVTKDGKKHIERYGLLTKDGEVNEGANKAFSYFAKTAMNNFNLEEIDHDDLEGCYIEAEVEHVQSSSINEKTGKPYVNANLSIVGPASGFADGSGSDAVNDSESEEDSRDDDDLDWLDDDE